MKANSLNLKLASCLVLSSLLFSVAGLTGTAEAAVKSSFPDVKDINPHLAAIEYLKSVGLLGGYPDGTFKPDQTINRAEALKIVYLSRLRLNLTDAVTTKMINFPDVKNTDWFFTFVQKAFDLQIVEGYLDGKFKPANEITKAESLKIVMTGIVKNYQTVVVSTAPFNDVLVSDWVAPYASYALSRQIIEMDETANFGPTIKITRAEFAELVYRTEFSEENKFDKYPLSQNWSYCNNYQLAYKIKYPPEWTKLIAGNQMILWKKDQENGQISFARVYPNSAVIIVALDPNLQHQTLQSYVDSLEYGKGNSKQVITLNGLQYASIFVEQSGLQDSYFGLPDGQILMIYAQAGDGSLSTKLKEQIRYIIGSVRSSTSASTDTAENCLDTANISQNNSVTPLPDPSAVPTPTNVVTIKDQITAEILKLVLIQGQAQKALDLADDKLLFETDSIGIGTGPVDYYYSAKLDLTIKLDRNNLTILATGNGKSSAF